MNLNYKKHIAASKIIDTDCRSLGSECPLSIDWRRFASSIFANIFQLFIIACKGLRLLYADLILDITSKV